MIIEKLFFYGLAACLAFGMQSLADLARQEAERRKALEGVEAKVIQENLENSSTEGNVLPPTTAATGLSNKAKLPSAKSYRSTIQKLDRSIASTEERLQLLRVRLQEERWALPKVGRLSRQSGTKDSQKRVQAEVEKLEIELKQMQQQRAETYEEGRKAGFLPGELDGKGIIP